MPKYFSGEKPLPYKLVRLKASEITCDAINKIFSVDDSVSLSLIHDGLHNSSLGYLVHIKKSDGGGFLISNITGEAELVATNDASLCVILKHVCGQEYSKDVKQMFQRNRNNIGANRNQEFFTTQN